MLRCRPLPVVALAVRRHTADTAAGAAAAGTPSPRVGLVIGLWQCDKENHGWREGVALTVATKFRSEDRPSPSRQSQSRTKKEYCFSLPVASPHSDHWPVINAKPPNDPNQ